MLALFVLIIFSIFSTLLWIHSVTKRRNLGAECRAVTKSFMITNIGGVPSYFATFEYLYKGQRCDGKMSHVSYIGDTYLIYRSGEDVITEFDVKAMQSPVFPLISLLLISLTTCYGLSLTSIGDIALSAFAVVAMSVVAAIVLMCAIKGTVENKKCTLKVLGNVTKSWVVTDWHENHKRETPYCVVEYYINDVTYQIYLQGRSISDGCLVDLEVNPLRPVQYAKSSMFLYIASIWLILMLCCVFIGGVFSA